MSEEEKKAINQLKADTNFYDYELKNGKYIYELFKIEVYKKDVDTVLDLINRQQKELEQEKEKNKELENADLTSVYMSGFYDGEKKWKDKIRAKIEELKIDAKNIREKKKNSHDYDRSKSRLQAYLTKTNEMIKRFEELLEE